MAERFIKLDDGVKFTVKSVGRPVFKKWDEKTKSFVTSLSAEKGYRRFWRITVEDEAGAGVLEIPDVVFGMLLISAIDVTKGTVNPAGKSFVCKAVGEGKDRKYFFNTVV